MRSFKLLASRLSLAAPFAVLVGTFGIAWVVRSGDEDRASLLGFAEGAPESIAAIEPARIESLHVSVGSEVTAGQVIASLDTSAIDSEIAIAQAEKNRIEAAVLSERTVLGRHLEMDRDTLEREATREREELARLDAEMRAYDGELERVKNLVAEHQAVASELEPMVVRRARLASLAQEKPHTLGVLNRQLDAATRRRAELDGAGSPTAAKLEADLLVVRRRLDMLERRRDAHQLRSASPGRVVSLEKHPGEIATAGEPIVKLVRPTKNVLVCVPEQRSIGLREGDSVRLVSRGRDGAIRAGHTVALGPMVAELPPRCWPNPKLAVWGREITVAIDTPSDVLAGETFSVVLDGTMAPLPKAEENDIPVAKNGSTPAPRRITVPAALARISRFEPSGVLARPHEGRYLVVSDDTGIKAGPDDGRPWLFAVDPKGTLDPSPITINGLAAIDDLEAIAGGDEGEIYALSSQSYSAHGKRRPPRTALLRLRADGRAFRVDGEIHIAELLDQHPSRAAALGLAHGTRALDIEGMTFKDGALYFGLKAPLTARGGAMVWKATSPRALFEAASGDEDAWSRAGIMPWAEVRVDVELGGKTVPGGISELLFRGDTLFVASTPSTADGAAGALWQIDRANGGSLAPTLVRRFPGMKPEGLSPSLDGQNLLVVFDAGSEPPSLLEVPWPR